jgi:hypothetical protein
MKAPKVKAYALTFGEVHFITIGAIITIASVAPTAEAKTVVRFALLNIVLIN